MRDFRRERGRPRPHLECAGLRRFGFRFVVKDKFDPLQGSVRTRSGSDGIKVVYEVSHDPVATARGSDTEAIPQRLCRRTLR